MNTVVPYMKIVSDYWNEVTHDYNLLRLTEVPGGWLKKVMASQRMAVNEEYVALHRRYYGQQTLRDTLEDNYLRFSLLALLERVTVARQAQMILKSRFEFGGRDLNSLIQTIRDNGAIKGFFRGNLINLFHFIGVQYQSLSWAQGDFLKYLGLSLAFETLLYPVETARTLIYADVTCRYSGVADCLKQTLSTSSYSHLYRGLSLKLAYNVIFGMNLWATHNESSLQLLTLPLWVFSYSLLVLKTRLQVTNTALSFQTDASFKNMINLAGRSGLKAPMHAGFAPFLFVNLVAMHTVPALLSEDVKRRNLDAVFAKAPQGQKKKVAL